MHEPAVALAASPWEWAQRLHRHVADHGGARIRATVLSAQEALGEDYDVLVADETTSFLTRRLVDSLHARGTQLLGVFAPDDARGKSALVDLGADDLVGRDATPEAFLQAVAALVATRAIAPRGVDGAKSAPAARAASVTRGRIVVFAGVSGGVGATECAIGVAAAAARVARSVVLVDADPVAPAVAQRLALPLYPNVRAAVDAVEHRDGELAACLLPRRGVRVLAGLPSGREWSELRAGEVAAVVERLAHDHQLVAVNVGPSLEDLRGVAGPARHGVTRVLVAAADAVVAVTIGTPVGLSRLLAWAADLRALAPARLLVAVNRAPRSGFARSELTAEVVHNLGAVPLVLLPEDPRVPAAGWAGDLVAPGPFTRAVTELARRLVPSGPDARQQRPARFAGARR